jgi:hypothetical protein
MMYEPFIGGGYGRFVFVQMDAGDEGVREWCMKEFGPPHQIERHWEILGTLVIIHEENDALLFKMRWC